MQNAGFLTTRLIFDLLFCQDKEGEIDALKNRKYLDFLDILLTARDENGNGLTPLEIRNEVDTFLFEGMLIF